jgi:cell division protein FtsB
MGILSMVSGANPFSLQIKAALVGAVIAAVAGGIFYVHRLNVNIATLETEKTQLIANNKVLVENNKILKDNVNQILDANATTNKTVASLVAERQDATKAIANLAAATANDKQTIANLKQNLADLIKDPKNDGLVAPALRETVRRIQDGEKK